MTIKEARKIIEKTDRQPVLKKGYAEIHSTPKEKGGRLWQKQDAREKRLIKTTLKTYAGYSVQKKIYAISLA